MMEKIRTVGVLFLVSERHLVILERGREDSSRDLARGAVHKKIRSGKAAP